MKLSIVTTLYASAKTVATFHKRATQAAQAFSGDDYEIIMVNDASPDETLALATDLVANDPHLTIVDLSRNFGQHRAMMVGLRQSQGEFVFALDDDLEEDPEWLNRFWQCHEETKADLVYGVQASRKGGWFERVSGSLFYRIFNWLSPTKIAPNMIMAKLMTRRFVDALIQFEERNLFMAGILTLTGFSQVPLVCVKKSKGSTSYTFARKIEQSVNSLTSFSSRPLYLIFYFGLLLSMLAFVFLVYIVGKKLVIGTIVDGWTSIMALMTLGFGMIIAVLGVIGIYLSKIFEEVKHRPYVTIRAILRQNKG
ncbi:MAG: glycosyltransferase family 2 protein [Desulfovibrio sp.]|nr:glycosyltransferase family 2 protein [Desulfovibrio sp.]